jgi:hypothetical protein
VGRHKTNRRARLAARLAGRGQKPREREPGLPPADLLSEIAASLNQADVEGVTVELAHGAVITDYGYVLRLDDVPGQRWRARTRMLSEFAVTDGED